MNEPIRYETKSDRELLVVVAQAINNLSQETTKLCKRVDENEDSIIEGRTIALSQASLIHGIIADNAKVSLNMAETLKDIHSLLRIHTEELGNLKLVAKSFWWIVGFLGALTSGVVYYVLRHIGFPTK